MSQRLKTPRAPVRNYPDPQPVPLNDPINETNEIPDDSDPRVAYIRLTYKWHKDTEIDPNLWKPHLLAFHRNDLYKDVVRDIRRYVHAKLQLHELWLCQNLDHDKSCMVFELTLQNNDQVKQHACKIDASGASRLRDMSDLWEGDVRPELEFTLRETHEEDRNVHHDLWRVRVRPRHDGGLRSQYFLIGSASGSPGEGDEEEEEGGEERAGEDADEDGKVQGGQAESEGDGKEGALVPSTNDFVTRFWKYTPGSNVILVKVPAWLFLDSCVCNVDAETVLNSGEVIPTNFEPSAPYDELIKQQAVKHMQFADLLRKFAIPRVAGTLTPHTHRRSEQVVYKFWDVDDAYPNLPVLPAEVEKAITVAVRFTQHLEAREKACLVKTMKYGLAGSFGYDSLHKRLVDDLSKMTGASALFKKHGKRWHLQLWVMHQSHKMLHRFKPGRDIRQFLRPDASGRLDPRLFLEAHIVSNDTLTESVPIDLPTSELMNAAGDDQVVINVVYDMKGDVRLQEMHGKSQVLRFSRHRSFQNLFTHLAHFVTWTVERYAPECYDYLEKESLKQYLLLKPDLIDRCPVRKYAFTLDKGGVARLSAIGDLLPNTPYAPGSGTTNARPTLEVLVKLIEPLMRTHVTDPLIEIRSRARDAKNGGTSQFYRIGTVLGTPTPGSSVSTSETFFWRVRGPVHDRKHMIVKAPTWTIRNFDICDPGDGEKIPDNLIHKVMRGQNTEAPLDPDAFRTMVQDSEIFPFTGGRLKYSFRRFGISRSCPRPLDGLPSTGISVAVRFVNHLTDHEAGKLKFTPSFELKLNRGDTMNSMKVAIEKEFKSASTGKTKALFKSPLEGHWDLQYWILPQIPGGRTLYKFEAGVQRLHWFLNQTEVNSGDRTLFMEAHLVPI